MTGALAAVGKEASQSPLDETTAWDDEQARRSRPLLARGRRSLGRFARTGGALLRRTKRSPAGNDF
jgi:hypothetical protein